MPFGGRRTTIVSVAGYAGSEPDDAATPGRPAPDRDPVRLAAKVAVVVLAVGAVAFGLWQVRSVVILLLLALTLAAAIRPGVEWLQRHRFPQPAAILSFFLAVGAIIVLFFWAAVPPALHQIEQALRQHAVGASVRESRGLRHDVLVWVDRYLHRLPSGHDVLHPVAAYGHQRVRRISPSTPGSARTRV